MNWTPLASPAPVLARVTVKPICSPAETLAASAALSTSIVAQRTSTEAVSESDPSLAVVDRGGVGRPRRSPPCPSWRPRGPRWRRRPRASTARRPGCRPRSTSRRRPGRSTSSGRPEGVRELDALGLALAGVLQRHREADLVAGGDAVVVGDLVDVDGRAVRRPPTRRRSPSPRSRRHRRGVVDLAAVLLVRGRDDVDRGGRAGREGRGREDQVAAAIDQPAEAGEIDQLRPAGRASVNCRPLASPSPVFVSVTVKPICSPAETLAASAVLSTSMARAVDVHRGGVGVRAVVGRASPRRCCRRRRSRPRRSWRPRAPWSTAPPASVVGREHEVAVRDRPAGGGRGDRPARGRPAGRR